MKKERIQCANKECTKQFVPKSEDQIYCSKACSRIRKKCPNCRKPFQMKRSNQDFCSRECRLEMWEKGHKRRFLNIEKLDSRVITCPHCSDCFKLSEQMLEEAGLLGRS